MKRPAKYWVIKTPLGNYYGEVYVGNGGWFSRRCARPFHTRNAAKDRLAWIAENWGTNCRIVRVVAKSASPEPTPPAETPSPAPTEPNAFDKRLGDYVSTAPDMATSWAEEYIVHFRDKSQYDALTRAHAATLAEVGRLHAINVRGMQRSIERLSRKNRALKEMVDELQGYANQYGDSLAAVRENLVEQIAAYLRESEMHFASACVRQYFSEKPQ